MLMLDDYPDDLDTTPEDFARYMLRIADCAVLAEVLKQGPLKVGSFCTGLGTCFIVLEAMSKVWNETKANEFGVKWVCEHVFAVEQDEQKRSLLLKHMAFGHVFEKVEDFAGGRAFDYTSNETVSTFSLEADLVLAGFMRAVSDIDSRPPTNRSNPRNLQWSQPSRRQFVRYAGASTYFKNHAVETSKPDSDKPETNNMGTHQINTDGVLSSGDHMTYTMQLGTGKRERCNKEADDINTNDLEVQAR